MSHAGDHILCAASQATITGQAARRLHSVGATLDPLISTCPHSSWRSVDIRLTVGSPATIAKMLEFAKPHNIKPVVEKFSFDRINEALDRLRSGKAHYRIVCILKMLVPDRYLSS